MDCRDPDFSRSSSYFIALTSRIDFFFKVVFSALGQGPSAGGTPTTSANALACSVRGTRRSASGWRWWDQCLGLGPGT